MKFITSLFLIIFYFGHSFDSGSVQDENKYSDAKEWGFKGKIKSVTTYVYENLQKKNGHWQISNDGILSVSTIHFDPDGNIIKIEDSSLTDRYNHYKSVMYFELKNGVKKAYKRYENNRIVEQGTYEWINPHYYKLYVTKENSYRIESYSKLNDKYREIEGGYTFYSGDLILESIRYFNVLDEKGFVIRLDYIDDLKHKKFSMVLEDVEYDKFDNLKKFAIVYKDSGELKFLKVRKYEYYP